MKRTGIGVGIGWLAGAAALALYSATAAPGIAELFDDSLEFQLVAPTFAIAHPTGYPLYTLLGGLWSRLLFPVGNWAWRMNLFSALAAAGAVGLLFLLARRLGRGSHWAGLGAALAFAFGPVWWSQATVAEVYTLHLLFVAALLYAAVSLPPRPTDRQIGLLCLLAGLSLTHHRTAFLLLPGLGLYLLWKRPDLLRPQRGWLLWAGGLLAPLLLYLYIPLRAGMGAGDLEGEYVNSWAGFWRHVLATGYTGFFADNPLAVARSGADWLALAVDQLGWLGLGLGLAGLLVGLLRRNGRAEWGLVWLVLAVNLLFALNYRVADVEVFWLPVFFCLALGVGGAIYELSDWLPPLSWQIDQRGWSRRLVLGLLLLVIALGRDGRAAPVDRSDDWEAHIYAADLAGVDFPPGSRVVGLRGQMTALQLMQADAGLAANAQAVALDDPQARRAFVEDAVAAGLPVYLTQEVAGIEEAFSFSGEGVLVRVWPRGEARSDPPAHPLAEPLDEGRLLLLGYDLTYRERPNRRDVQVTFHWQPVEPIPRRLKLSLRLLDGSGEAIHSEDRYPLRLVAPTSAWLPGETLQDVHLLPLPAGAVSLLVIVYDEATVAEVGRAVLPLP